MTAKLKNDPNKYLTRAKLGGAGTVPTNALPTKAEVVQADERVAKGTLDNRWYVQMALRKGSRQT